ncbi:anthranilate synthase component II [Natrinema versiforme]|uniref:anthranilate synthase n=1 Tax=Natrinema versiforme JCM 10478 TaxID=1227496 RepID=L9YAS5_9EURY|nr:aminodeoxychorismate/anthranilate synthase component II [Natrinema versiforme]ELY71179.1 glutamine amidotransferase of anthranilate synthase [Natrinema versiforme JCM 10478]
MTESTPETRILVVDNYDSFAYNLVQYVGEVADEVIVRRNDEIDVAGVRDLEPTGIVVSPGPGTPQEAGVSMPLFAETDIPILGVCLGHQALCAANGAPVVHAPDVVHGKPSAITHDGEGLFAGLPETFQVGRYHSLSVDRADLPESLVETARTADERGVLMAVRHRENPHLGVQFHPESILTRAQPDAATGSDDADGTDGTNGTDDGSGDDISLDLGKRLIANFCRFAAAADRGGNRA